jgi:hypothetical protein
MPDAWRHRSPVYGVCTHEFGQASPASRSPPGGWALASLGLPGITEAPEHQQYLVALTQVAHDLHRGERKPDQCRRNNDQVVDGTERVKEYVYNVQFVLAVPKELFADRLEVGEGADRVRGLAGNIQPKP